VHSYIVTINNYSAKMKCQKLVWGNLISLFSVGGFAH